MSQPFDRPYKISYAPSGLSSPTVQHGVKFVTFWHGDALSPYEWMCLKSFRARHKDVYLASYDDGVAVPEGVQVINANDICDKAMLSKFIYFGNVSLAGFTDYLRYKLIHKFGFCWFDADMICVSSDVTGFDEFVFGFEHEHSINNALLKFPQGHPVLLQLIGICEDSMGKDLEWGALGPILLTRLLTESGLRGRAHAPHKFYALNVVNFWQFLLPKYREKVMDDTRNSWSVHLWNELYKQIGNWKNICPPQGSYIHAKAVELGCVDKFIAVYPESIMQNVVDMWITNYERKVELSTENQKLKEEINRLKSGATSFRS